jgi:hypothetical protein
VIFSSQISAQSDCVLGVGSTNDSVLINVFQLSDSQIKDLMRYGEEIRYRQEILDTKLENIKNRHPQSTVLELSKLATEYTVIIDSMASVQTMIDKRLLSLFNEKQYTLYRNLCLEASRSPFIVAPTIYTDTIDVKKRTTILDNLKDKN